MLVALLDGEPIVALDLTAEQFAEVRARSRQDRKCLRFRDGLAAIPRSGPVRGPHFSHQPGEGGTTGAETIHYVRAKLAVRDVAQSRGWTAEIEVRHPSGRWQADVLIEKGPRLVAFEVQWSPQTLEEYMGRTNRYLTDGVETVWLAKYSLQTWWQIVGSEIQALPLKPGGVGCQEVYPLKRAIDECLANLEESTQTHHS